MRKTKEEAEATRLLIMEAATECFAAQGIHACSLAQIAESAGLTRGAIYWHFKNKEELLEAILIEATAPLIAMETEILQENETDPLGKLRHLLILLLRKIATDEKFRRVAVLCQRSRLLSALDEPGFAPCRIQKLTAERLERRINILKSAVRQGQLTQDLDCAAAANFILASIEGIAQSWMNNPNNFNLDALADHYIDAMLAGVATITTV